MSNIEAYYLSNDEVDLILQSLEVHSIISWSFKYEDWTLEDCEKAWDRICEQFHPEPVGDPEDAET